MLQQCGSYQTPDWINSVDLADLDGDGTMEVIVGCLDSSVHAVKISPS